MLRVLRCSSIGIRAIFLLTQVIYGRLRSNHEHLPVRWKKFRRRDYAYGYLILVISRTIVAIVSSTAVRAVSYLYTLNIMSAITDYVTAHLVSKKKKGENQNVPWSNRRSLRKLNERATSILREHNIDD